MNLLNVFLLALALSVDAFIVSFSYGLIIKNKKGRNSLNIALATGLGQFIMPVLGWYGARTIYKQIEQYDHWIAFFVFAALGIKIIADSFKDEDKKKKLSKTLSFKMLLAIGIATSIDAFVSGSMLYFMKEPVWASALFIGFVTFVCSFIGFYLSHILKKLPTRYIEILSGLILIGLGVKVLFEHIG